MPAKFHNPGSKGFTAGGKLKRATLGKTPKEKYFPEDKFLKGLSRNALLGTGIAIGGAGATGGMYASERWSRSKNLQELSAHLDNLIEFFDPSIFGKIPSWVEAGRGIQRAAAGAAGAAQRGYAAAAPVVTGAVKAAAPVVQRGASAIGRGVTAADAVIGRGRQIAGNVAGTVAGAAATGVVGAAEGGYGAVRNVVSKIGAARQAGKAKSALQGGTRSYFDRSYGPGGINAPIGGTPPPVPAHLASPGVSSAPTSAPASAPVPAAAPPGTQAQAAQAAANQAGQQAGQAAAAAPPTAVRKSTGKKATGKKGKKAAAKEPEGGWWSQQSPRKKWMIGAGSGLAAGGAGLAYVGGDQNFSAWLDDIINFADPRPRNPLGEFQSQGEGGPDPNAMATVYKQPGLLSTAAKGGALAVAGGALGQVGGTIGEQLLNQAKKKARTVKIRK